MMHRALLLLAFIACAAACGPVPHPFSGHPDANPLVDDRRVTSSVQVVPVPAYPGLAEAVVRDLAGQDVLATTHDPGPRKVLISATVENASLVWRAATPDNVTLGTAKEPALAGQDVATLARGATPLIISLLTAEGGIADPSGRPHVTVNMVHGPSTLKLDALTQAMVDALAGQGLFVTTDHAVAIIDGDVQVMPGNGGQDVLQVAWTVRDPKGASLGRVAQGSPVYRKVLAGPMTNLSHDIATAAAPGILNVIRQKLPSAFSVK